MEIKTTRFLLKEVSTRNQCSRCKAKIELGRLFYLRQISTNPALQYELICESCKESEQ
jgi:hypothetical protein